VHLHAVALNEGLGLGSNVQEANMREGRVEIGTRTIVKTVGIVAVAWVLAQVIWKVRDPLIWWCWRPFLHRAAPVIQRVERYTWRRRGWPSRALTLVGLGVFGLLTLRVVPLLVEQTQHLIAFLPAAQQSLSDSNNPLAKLAGHYQLLEALQNSRDRIIGFVVNSFSAIFFGSINFIGVSITIYVLMVYFMMGGPHWAGLIQRTRYGGWWRRHEDTLRAMAAAVSGMCWAIF
jgi:predicted PurR-regulated permease PerM